MKEVAHAPEGGCSDQEHGKPTEVVGQKAEGSATQGTMETDCLVTEFSRALTFTGKKRSNDERHQEPTEPTGQGTAEVSKQVASTIRRNKYNRSI